ncbi:MAG: SIMPL domain-containing protein, partial [Alphaproteobacteria bacterium]|nr:SIMPL domain-containing protein [Alphaproteobacteria bacterium]
MKTGIWAAVMFVALLAASIVIIKLVRVPDMYAIEGRGEVRFTPDQAEITASIYIEANVSLDAVKETAATMRNIIAALKASQVPATDIATDDVKTGRLEMSDNERRAADAKRSYFAEQIVIVKVRDLARIGTLLDAISRAGSNYWLVHFTVADRAKYEAQARKAAFLNALATADEYARDGRFHRGRVLKIQDDAVAFPEVDYADRGYRMRRDSRGGSRTEKVVVTGSRITELDT